MRKTNINWLLTLFAVFGFVFYGNAQYLTESFEGSFPPTDWAIVNNGSGNDWAQSTSTASDGSNSMYYSYNSSNAADAWAFTKAVTLVAGTNIQIFFDYKVASATYPEKLKVTVGSDQTVASQTTTLWDNNGGTELTNTSFETALITYTVPADGDYYFAFNCYSDANQWNLFVDNVIIRDEPSCPDPSALTATNITTTTADLGWTTGGASTWDIELGTQGFTPTGTPTYNDVTTNPYNVTGLTANTSYDFYVRDDCGADNVDTSNWVGPFSFTTACDVVSSFPYTEDFETTNSTPDCWGETRTPSSGYGWASNSNGYENNCFRFDSYYNSNGNKSVLNTATFDFSSETALELRFWWKNPTGGNFRVMLSTDGGATYSDTLADNLTGVSTYEEKIIDLTSYCGAGNNNIVIGFEGTSNYGSGDAYVYLDKLTIQTPPSCLAPTGLTATDITNNSAIAHWVSGGSTNYNIVYGPTGFNMSDSTAIAVTDTFYNITGLTANTTYDFYVQDSCGVGDVSTWTGPYTFTTECDVVSSFPYTEDFENVGNIPDCWHQGAGNSEDWNFSNDVTAPGHIGNAGNVGGTTSASGGYFAWVDDSSPNSTGTTMESPLFDISSLTHPELTFYMISDNEGAENAELVVDVWDGSNWNTVFTNKANTNNWEEKIVDLSAYTGTIKLRFVVNEDAAGNWYDDIAIDDVSIHEAPSCPAPTGLTATDITNNSAIAHWVSGGSTNYNIVYGPTGFNMSDSTAIAVTDTFYNIIGLTGNTTYDFYVQDSCGVGDVSTWTGPYTFTTECDVVTTFPWVEGFEDNGNAPMCWSQEYVSGTHDWIYQNGDGTLTAFEGSYNARFAHQNYGDVSKLITPMFDLTSVSNPTLSFAHAQRVWSGDQDSLKVYYRISPTDAWVLIPGAEWNNDIQDWTVETFTLPNPSATYQIAFEAYDQYGHGVLIDSVYVGEAPVSNTIDLALIMPGNDNYSDCSFTGQDTVPFHVQNVGTAVVAAGDTIFGWYEVDGNAAVADTFVLANDLNPNDVLYAQFTQTTDLAGYTTHNFKVYLNYINDTNNVNDTTVGTVTHYQLTVDLGGTNDTIQVTAYPYTLDAGTGYDSYLWNDSTTNQTLDVNADGWYSVVVTDTNGCEATDSVYVILNTGINTFDNVIFSIYPNPNNGQFTVNAKLNSQNDFNMSIIDINGKVVFTKHFDGVNYVNETINLNSLAKGVYYVQLQNNNFVKQEKVIIK